MSKNKKHGDDISTKTFYISGMHCASCELLIEKKLLSKDGINAADVSVKNTSVTFSGKKADTINSKYLNKLFVDLGYTFSTNKISNGRSEQMLNYVIVIVIILLTTLFFVTVDMLIITQYTDVDQDSSLIAFIILGLVASVSSCAALVGGLLLSLTKQWNDTYIGESKTVKLKPHIQFHIGRITAFAFGGAILGTIGDILSFDNITIFAIIIVTISIIMLIISMQMIGLPWAQKFRIALPKSILIKISKHKIKTHLLIGASTFFIPCGFTIIAQGIALTTGSAIEGSLIMIAFAIGTLPVLLTISFGGVSFNSKPHLTAKFNVIAGAFIFIFALYNINGQLNVLGLPSLSDIGRSTQKQEAKVVVTNKGQQQVMTFIADKFEYIPTSTTTIRAGVPTKLIVDNRGVQGCGIVMAARGLFAGTVNLKLGENIIEFTPKKGKYKLTCSMGMVPPVIINVI